MTACPIYAIKRVASKDHYVAAVFLDTPPHIAFTNKPELMKTFNEKKYAENFLAEWDLSGKALEIVELE